ncbi:hypothetical protein NM208_g6654 [Fusarium decemcellulare]|uniref:Uncharacterized protein n=1 Tax=Fusarium decemcellulare TaxID=57161 RepID=A0ACC1SCA9_9HYPO|nr:hypothetical protein NM208_g6654 [Fusarium decemcellulare]
MRFVSGALALDLGSNASRPEALPELAAAHATQRLRPVGVRMGGDLVTHAAKCTRSLVKQAPGYRIWDSEAAGKETLKQAARVVPENKLHRIWYFPALDSFIMVIQILPIRYSNGDVLESFLYQRFGYGQYSASMENNSWTITVPQLLTASEIAYINDQMRVHY